MAEVLPESVNPNPPEVSPPKCLSGQTMITLFPDRAISTAEITAAEVPP
ncbi:hypothetical protein SDC9_163829 [bioreactor metagenome]|uniref:Uncharacterized protein n=1 Tax=bioreactor metagenome TaxID=1076179 RepID=A0A645FPY6_9ZZZZ